MRIYGAPMGEGQIYSYRLPTRSKHVNATTA